MPLAIDGTKVPAKLNQMSCGGVPYFDHDSGYAYRCDICGAIIGSIGQPNRCKELNEKDEEYDN